ncbi:cytochrome b [Komagataeibacter diospyri]|uniref:Cytochrome B561 n=1 Tax=Komagataeibacter diospyri TaxID=1932662 RepID=A0A4P5NNG4_9PROT|nr:cytochrome b [Komagataeibacter diospyri]GCE82017.1 cytochrome B561 [Komagataeibacter diospyri]GCE88851.1 cytochrome B561 [Komagataeibacter diospyri]
MKTGMTHETLPARRRYDAPTVFFYWSCAAIIMLQFISADIWGLFHNPLRHQLLVSHLTAGMVPSSATARAHRVADRVGATDVRIRPLAGLSLGLLHQPHQWNCWLIIFLATGHALAACFHYFTLRDNVLQRMFMTGNISNGRK